MNLDFLIFPAPKSKYNPSFLSGELIWIPKKAKKNENIKKILTDTSTCCGDANIE